MRLAALGGALVASVAHAAFGQIVLDDSFGPAEVLVPEGADTEIAETLGRRAGQNLFHSFAQFDVPAGESATFTSHGPGIERVIARVTGPGSSQIDGLLRSRIPGADLWLLNPKGVFFGSGARLDLGGSLFASTAHWLEFDDAAHTRYAASGAVTLSSAAPSAWGFTDVPAPIVVDRARLEVGSEGTLSLVGGDLSVRGQPGVSFGQPVLVAPGGTVELIALAGPGSVALGANGAEPAGDMALGDVSISQAQITTAGARSGSFRARAHDLVLDRGFVFSDSSGDQAPLPVAIDVRVRGELLLRGPAELTAEAMATASIGAIHIEAESLRLIGAGALVNSWVSTGSARGGDVDIYVAELELRDGAQLIAQTNGAGDGGDLRVRADSIEVSGSNSLVATFTTPRSTRNGPFGDAGGLDVRADDIALHDGGQLLSVTRSSGDGGNVHVEADTLTIAGISGSSESRLSPAGVLSNEEIDASRPVAGIGRRGDVYVRADTIEVRDGGVIQNRSFIQASSQVPAPTLVIDARSVVLIGSRDTSQSGVLALSVGRDAAHVELQADELHVLDGALVTASTEGSGQGGQVEIAAARIRIAGRDDAGVESGIFSQTRSRFDDAGDGGDVFIATRDLELRDGGDIAVSTTGPGDGGRLHINDADHDFTRPEWTRAARIAVRDGEIRSSALRSSPLDSGVARRGGDISIRAHRIDVGPGGRIAALNAVNGDAGNVELEVLDALRLEGGEIRTEARQGLGGNVTVRAGELVSLFDATIATNVTTGSGDGGNVSIDPRSVVLNSARIEARADRGNGGDIVIIAGRFLRSADSVLDASSRLGVDGQVVIRSPVEDLAEQVAPVRATFLGAEDLLERGCAAQRTRSGSLTVARRVVRIGAEGVLGESSAESGSCDAP